MHPLLQKLISSEQNYQKLFKEEIDKVLETLGFDDLTALAAFDADKIDEIPEISKIREINLKRYVQFGKELILICKDLYRLKHPAFEDEKEFRLIRLANGDKTRLKFYPKNNIFVPYIPVDMIVSGTHLPIKEIIVGPMPHQDIAVEGLIGFLESKGQGDIVVKASKIPYREL